MNKYKKLDNYLNYLNEQLVESLLAILAIVAQQILFLIIFILGTVNISITDKKLSKKIYNITGKKFDVRIFKEEHPAAFCFGGLTNHIFASSGLLQILNERELIAVCLHESSHIISYDSIKKMIIRISSLSVPYLFISNFANYILVKKKVNPNNFLILAVLLTCLMLFVPSLVLGKYNELKSDKYTVQFGYGRDLMSALEKLERWVLKNKIKDSKIKMFFHKIQHWYDEHPPIKKRVDKLLHDVELYESISTNNKMNVKKIIDKTILDKNNE